MEKRNSLLPSSVRALIVASLVVIVASNHLFAQGVTTASLTGIITSDAGEPLAGVNVIALHEPSGTKYGAPTRENGQYNILNMRVGGPYTVTVSIVGYRKESQPNIHLSLGQDARVDFQLVEEAVLEKEVVVTAEQDVVLNSGRTGAATYVNPRQVQELPSVKRSTRDLTRLDPRSDGNFSFGGKNWLYNNISLDGSYFNNPFGLDDPAPGGQTGAEPVPFDAVEQVQVSVVPFDVREGGFTGAGINTVTKSGTNEYKGSLYSFYRNEEFLGNKVSGTKVISNPDLTFNQSGFSVSGPLIVDKLFFFVNGEIDRREDPGSNFVANRGTSGLGISRVRASTMDSIRQRMIQVYGYDPGPYEGYIHRTDNEKLLLKLDWNISEDHNLTFRYDLLNAKRDLPPHPFVLSFAGTGRGSNENSMPFRNSGYRINNKLNSFALEVNSRFETISNRFFASYNRFRDFREPFSTPFPTIEIGENGITYTTIGHEPFSIHNILDQDVWQFTNNVSYFTGSHVVTVGANFELFTFFNSFNIFRHGLFGLPFAATTFFSLNDFFTRTNPADTNFIDLLGMITPSTIPFKGEDIQVAQLSVYAQDEYLASADLNVTFGLRVDFPMYFKEPVDNPFSRSRLALDEEGNPEAVDQSKLAKTRPLFSPRIGFNWDATGDRSTQVRGGTGIFTGRIPFVWVGNVISNPGANPNLYGPFNPTGQKIATSGDGIPQQSFDLNGMDPDFKWPQAWTTNFAVDHKLPGDMLGTLEFLYSKDINAVYVRNADLDVRSDSVRFLRDRRPRYGGTDGNSELNPDFGAGIYVIDNTSEGYNYSITAQLRKTFDFGFNASVAYTFLQAKSQLKSTEIASVLWTENPVQGNPNKPELSYSEFGQRHRIIATGTYRHEWSENVATSFGLFAEAAEGGRFAGAGGNRYSFVYSGDVNGDGMAGNDLIYIPRNANDPNEILFQDIPGGLTAAQQAQAFEAFIQQDDYLSSHRGEIAERFGAVNPWYSNIDLKILQDLKFDFGTFQLSLDVLNFANMLNSDWGVRKVANAAATSPLQVVGFNPQGEPILNFRGPKETFIDDPGLNSRWQAQLGLRYIFGE